MIREKETTGAHGLVMLFLFLIGLGLCIYVLIGMILAENIAGVRLTAVQHGLHRRDRRCRHTGGE